jgi:hypothetical protein
VVGPRGRYVGAPVAGRPGLSPAEHYSLRDEVDAAYAPFVAADGSVELPARTYVAAASA